MVTATNSAPQSVESLLLSLQPIKDLARNWDIDIAHSLEEYLHEIIGDAAPPEGGRELFAENPIDAPNFAQAAMVLQNSSSIYSRKVEYLHSLVFRALDDLVMARINEKSSRSRKSTSDDDIDEFFNFDLDQSFLLLDDIVPTDNSDSGNKISLPDNVNEGFLDRSVSSRRTSRTRLSLGRRSSFASASNSSAIAVVAHRLSVIDSLTRIGFRLVSGSCDIGEDGRLRMPGTGDKHRSSEHIESTADMIEGLHAQYDNYEDDNDGGSFMLADDEHPVYIATSLEPPKLPTQHTKRVTFSSHNVLPSTDEWALLDPHSKEREVRCPLRLGKTICLPHGLDDLPSECVTGARTRRVPRTEPFRKQKVQLSTHSRVATVYKATIARKRSLNDSFRSQERSMLEEVEASPLLQAYESTFGVEFSYMSTLANRRRASHQRKDGRPEESHVATQKQAENESLIQAFDVNRGLLDGDVIDNDDDFDGDFRDDDDNGALETNTGLSSVEDIYHDRGNKNESEQGVWRTFAELCRAHIESFAKGAEQYAAETGLALRVRKWQEKLSLVLDEEENRPFFDIHDYGLTLISVVQGKLGCSSKQKRTTKHVLFSEIVENQAPYEVCRTFIACLSLCNLGNIKLLDKTRIGEASLQIELLSGNIERPMTTFLAPSLAHCEGVFSL